MTEALIVGWQFAELIVHAAHVSPAGFLTCDAAAQTSGTKCPPLLFYLTTFLL